MRLSSFAAAALSLLTLARTHELAQKPLQAMGLTQTISDVLGLDSRTSAFTGIVADVESVTSLIDDSSAKLVFLVPSNHAMLSLPKKPWENDAEYQALGVDAYEGSDGQERAHANVRRFVEAHLVQVPSTPWQSQARGKTVLGREIWWTESDGKIWIQPDDVEVTKVQERAVNGEIWVISKALERTS